MSELRDLLEECKLCVQKDSVYIRGDKSDGLITYNKTNNQVLFRIRYDHYLISYQFECRDYCISLSNRIFDDLYIATEKKYYEQSIDFLKNQVQLTNKR